MAQTKFATTCAAVLLVALSLSLLPIVSAHGFVRSLTIDGKEFKGNTPDGKVSPSGIRLINDFSPVKGAKNPNVNCGPGAKPASENLAALPGSVLEFDWSGGDEGNWFHNTGPMITYLANCGSTTCDKFDSTKAKWFKIDQVGRTKKGGPWAQAALQTGAPASVTLPKTLAAGNYLVRHEIIALHLANTKGGAEFYPSCAQLKVGGTQTGVPTASELVSLPGAYTDTHKGIFDPEVFDVDAAYNFPGPAIAKLGATESTATSASAAKKSSSASSCKKPSSKKRMVVTEEEAEAVPAPAANTTTTIDSSVVVPRSHSRIMRELHATHRSLRR